MIGQRLADRYLILSELGRGGMGVVYRARDPLLDRDVAVKLVPPNLLTEENQERLKREAKIVAAMDHPAIVPVYDMGEHEGSLFFVMPVVTGSSLRKLVREQMIGVPETLAIGVQVAQALAYSHARGVLHRDVKPDNIMVPITSQGELRVRVMDFGLARTDVQSRITRSGVLVGTTNYLSPEQVMDRDVDHRSDIYSLGTVLYECIAGSPPFSGDFHSVLHQIVYEDPPPFPSRDAPVDEIEDLILHCLAKNPRERPQEASQLAERLLRCQRDMSDDQLQSTLNSPLLEVRHHLRRDVPFIGRKKELAELRSRFDRMLGGECQFVLVAGEEGMGKGHLLREFERTLPPGIARVLRGRFVEHDSGFPFYGYCEIVQNFFRGRAESEPASEARELDDLAPDLVGLFPVLMEVPALRRLVGSESDLRKFSEAPRENPLVVFELLARTLARLGSNRPLVLFLESLHQGEVSIEALQYIVRRLSPTRTLLVGTYRPDEVDSTHALSRMMATLRGDRTFTHLRLAALTPVEHRSLLSAILGGLEIQDAMADRLYEATDGNPFFTKDLVQTLHDFNVIARNESGSWYFREDHQVIDGEFPVTIQQSVERRIRNLEPALQEILTQASILGKSFDYDDLEFLVGDRPDLDESVDRLLELALLEELPRSREDRLSFTSGAVRDVLYRKLTRRKRRLHHRRFAEKLEERHRNHLERVAAQLYYHFCRAEEPEKVVRYGLLAARGELTAFSPRDALHTLKTVIDFIEDERWEGSGEDEAEAHFLLARAHRSLGDLDAAIASVEESVRLFSREGESPRRLDAVYLAAESAWERRRIDKAVHWVREGLESALGPDQSAARSRFLNLGATLESLRGEHDRARVYLEEAGTLTRILASEEETEAGGSLTVGVSQFVPGMDPVLFLTAEAMEIYANVFETLFTTDGRGNLRPHLCKRWEILDGGSRFVLDLTPEVFFHDGTRLEAADVKRSIERAIRLTSTVVGQNPVKSAFGAIRGAGSDTNGDVGGIEVLSPERVRIDLEEPLPIFLSLLTNPQTAIVRDSGTDGALVGTGPFRIAGSSSEDVVLERHCPYWKGTDAVLDRVAFRTVGSRDLARELRSGELDIVHDLEPGELDLVLRDPRFRTGLVEQPRKNIFFLLFNTHRLTDARVRMALARALPVHDLVWSTLGRFGLPATGMIPPGILGHHPGRRLVPAWKMEEVTQLLEEAGAKPLELRAAVHPALQERYHETLERLLSVWREAGAVVRVETPSMEVFLDQFEQNEDIDLWIGRWVADYDDADNFTHGLFHSATGLLRNYACSSEMDDLMEAARVEQEPAAREDLYLRIEKGLVKSAWVVPLFHEVDYRLAGPRVRRLRLESRPPYLNYSEIFVAPTPVTPARGARAREVLEVPMTGSLRTLDPASARSLTALETLPNVFETLTRVGEGAHVEPWLAASIEAEDGARRFRCRLREDVRFHGGRRLTARDVRYSFERALRIGGKAASGLRSIRGAREVIGDPAATLDGFSIQSAFEFTLELERPVSIFPMLLTHPAAAILPEQASFEDPGSLVGTGPFRVFQFLAGERLELESNPDYWRPGLPRSSGLAFLFHLDPERVVSDFRNGRFSLVLDLDATEAEKVRNDSDLGRGYREIPALSTSLIQLNTRSGPLRDLEIRQRVLQAIDVSGLQSRLGISLVSPATTLTPPSLLGVQPRRASRGSSGSKERTLRGLSLKAAVLPAPRIYSRIGVEISHALRRQGVRLRVVNRDLAGFFEELAQGDVDLVLGRWCAQYPDPDAFFHPLYDPEVGYLRAFFGTEESSRLIAMGRAEGNNDVRRSIYMDLEGILSKESAILPMFHEQVSWLARPGLEGLSMTFGYPRLAYEHLRM